MCRFLPLEVVENERIFAPNSFWRRHVLSKSTLEQEYLHIGCWSGLKINELKPFIYDKQIPKQWLRWFLKWIIHYFGFWFRVCAWSHNSLLLVRIMKEQVCKAWLFPVTASPAEANNLEKYWLFIYFSCFCFRFIRLLLVIESTLYPINSCLTKWYCIYYFLGYNKHVRCPSKLLNCF